MTSAPTHITSDAYQQRSERFFPTIFEMAKAVADSGTPVILLGRVPMFETVDRLREQKSLSYPFLDCSMSDRPLGADVAEVNAILSRFAAQANGVESFDIVDGICKDGITKPFRIGSREIADARGASIEQ